MTLPHASIPGEIEMPLKSRTQEARAARTATPESNENDSNPGNSESPQNEAPSSGGRGVRRPASAANKPAETTPDKPAAAKRGRPAGGGAKKAATLPPAGDKKAAKARMKAILAEAKTLQKDRKVALKELGDEFDGKLKALKAEYGTLAAQASADAFPV